jgi:hypothetical protein
MDDVHVLFPFKNFFVLMASKCGHSSNVGLGLAINAHKVPSSHVKDIHVNIIHGCFVASSITNFFSRRLYNAKVVCVCVCFILYLHMHEIICWVYKNLTKEQNTIVSTFIYINICLSIYDLGKKTKWPFFGMIFLGECFVGICGSWQKIEVQCFLRHECLIGHIRYWHKINSCQVFAIVKSFCLFYTK